MSGPPTDISPSELWEKLAKAERPFELVDFPRVDPLTGEPMGKIAVVVLTQGEIITAKAEATRYARACIKEKFDAAERVEGYAQVFEDACATELVWRFCRRPENRTLYTFPNAAKVREKLVADEVAVLVNAYALTQLKLGPITSTMDDDEYEAWIKRLREGGSATPLAWLSWEQRTALTMYMASRHATSPTASSSAGRPPDASTPSSDGDSPAEPSPSDMT